VAGVAAGISAVGALGCTDRVAVVGDADAAIVGDGVGPGAESHAPAATIAMRARTAGRITPR